MDIRIEIIQKVVDALQRRVGMDVLNTVQDVLTVELDKYEVQERCTDVAVPDFSGETLLRKFIATKTVEGLAKSTLKRYADECGMLIRFLRKPLYEVTTYDLRFALACRRQTGRVSNRTLDGIRKCYSTFFGWLSAEGLIGRNPCAALKQIKYRKTIEKPFSAAEMESIKEVCKNARDLALVDFLYCTGCRVSEVSHMDIADVDFEKMECKVLGKGDKERIVYMTDVAAMHLRKYLDSRRDDSPALFAGKGSRRIGKNAIEDIVRCLARRAGVQGAHPHRYRRTLATNLLDRDMNLQDVAKVLGHEDTKTTQIYCYISQSNVKAAYRKYAA